jgi:E3 ubiquitin-protein ligase synoviolin
MTRTQLYVGVSTLLANLVLLRAYYERPNFYSAAVYISQSNGSLMLLINLALIAAVGCGYGLQRLLYGPLRPIETEQLYDKAWFAVSETLLAMTIFRDDIGVWFFAMFLCLLGGKVWQWIGEGRVEFLEQQPPANPRLFHARLSTSLVLSVLFDAFMVRYCLHTILQDARPGMMVMFGFEYVLLFIVSASTLGRYALSVVELVIVHRQTQARAAARLIAREQARQSAEGAAEAPAEEEDDDDDDDVPGWEEKGRWVFYLDLFTDFIKSVVYLGFFLILIAFHGIPIHIMRDLFMTFRSLIKRVNDFLQYRNATRDMNARYPDATPEDLGRESTCIVCREEMRPWVQPGADGAQDANQRRVDERSRPKKLPCGHILHFSCLRSWLERQQVCPTCRRPVLAETRPQNTQQPNQANPGQQNAAGGLGLFGFGQANQGNQQQPQGGQPGQGQQNGQPNRPVPNVRVFNFGPLRIALGNVRVPANNQQNQNNHNEAIANLAQRLAQAGPNQQQPATTPNFQLPGLAGMGIPAGPPGDIQGDILRIQENIIHSMRQLNAQHTQLQHIQTLLGELYRLQHATGTAGDGLQLPPVAPLNPQWGPNGLQQAYVPPQGSAVMGPGDPNLPAGLTLPEGWSLRRLAPIPQPTGQRSPTEQQQSEQRMGSAPPSSSGDSQPTPTSTEPASLGNQSSSNSPDDSSSGRKVQEPVTNLPNWGSRAVAGSTGAEASSSSAGASSSEEQSTTRRRVTIEDDADDGN